MLQPANRPVAQQHQTRFHLLLLAAVSAMASSCKYEATPAGGTVRCAPSGIDTARCPDGYECRMTTTAGSACSATCWPVGSPLSGLCTADAGPGSDASGIAATGGSGSGGSVTIGTGGVTGNGGGSGTGGVPDSGSGGASSSGTGGQTGAGGTAPVGGRSGSGGASGNGGSGSGGAATGGRPGSGGSPGSGGRPGSGGSAGSGGRPGTGGSPGSGGAGNAAPVGTGGAPAGTGGRVGTGGSLGTGGSGTGGAAPQGVTEFVLPVSNLCPTALASGPDGAIWFAAFCGGSIGRITTSGVMTHEIRLPTPNSEPTALVSGPDNNIWVVLGAANKVARITLPITDNPRVDEFPIPTPGSYPYSIAVGSDRNLWFGTNNGRVGRTTTSGAITEFEVGGQVYGVTSGPDGNLWFTSSASGAVALSSIGRMTVMGVRTGTFTFVDPNARPGSICAAPQGNLWFTDLSQPKFGRITTSGEMTQFSSGSRFPTHSVTVSSDNTVWIVDYDNKLIEHRSPSSDLIKSYSISYGAAAIAIGPDGNTWFGGGSNRIGRIVP